jgi:hypothetical protein
MGRWAYSAIIFLNAPERADSRGYSGGMRTKALPFHSAHANGLRDSEADGPLTGKAL